MANGTSKTVGLGKFWQDLKIFKAFLTSLGVPFLHDLFLPLFKSQNFLPRSLGLGFLTRISASRRVSDFTIRHPYCGIVMGEEKKALSLRQLQCSMSEAPA